MKTSSFFTASHLPGAIGIARYCPKAHVPAAEYKALAPGIWFNRVAESQYRRLFADKILSVLDPQKVWDDLHAIAGGAEPVLLCWEKTKDVLDGSLFCHRRIVASWFKETLGHDVPEMTRAEARSGQNDLFALTIVCRECGTGHLDAGIDTEWKCRKCGAPLPKRSKLNLVCDRCGESLVTLPTGGKGCIRCVAEANI